MGLKKIILGGNEVHLTTKTEQRLFELVCEERKQNEDLVRFVYELNRDIKNQQELLESLAEHLKNYKKCERTDIKDSASSKDSTDEEGSSSERETGPGSQKNLKKRKLSASPDHSDQDENKSHQ